MGGSYGGYAALAGIVFTPRRWACGVALAGPSNLVRTVVDGPSFWDRRSSFLWIGDPRDDAGRRDLLRRSPSEWVEWVERPLLVAHGSSDVTVSRTESDDMVAALRRAGKPVTYLMFLDEGHGLSKPRNVIAYGAVVEAFLGRHLGGRVEPIGPDLDGTDLIVLAGADLVPGLRATRPARESVAPRPPAPSTRGRRPSGPRLRQTKRRVAR
jgi:dipeptidyl aminopeptidase/acylaminoacyl peptidase